jgi:acylphosphatase
VARAVRVLVSGRVQGVCFRQATAETARAAGATGWVRNLPDGRVEAWLQGPEPAVEGVLRWIRGGGPPAAQVDEVEVVTQESADRGLAGFVVRR